MRDNGMARVISSVADEGTFAVWDFDVPDPAAATGAYADELRDARAATGRAESVLAGECLVGGRRVAVILSDFDFLAGSVGRRACRIVIDALDRARAESLPVFASPASGGTRMQEGTAAFVLMADVAAAVTRLRDAGSLMLVWLRHPTTGGVMATWGSLGTITIGEPGALAGFLGPRVFEMLNGEPFPRGVPTTENLASHGVIDEVVPIGDLRAYVGNVLAVALRGTVGGGSSGSADRRIAGEADGVARIPADPALDAADDLGSADPWDAVLRTRNPDRPGVADLISVAADVTVLHGTGEGERGDAVVVALANVAGQPCVLIGQDRAAQAAGHGLNPAALRTARRGIRVAMQLSLPIVTVIDTAGAELSAAAEEAAMAGEIARCLSELTAAPVPTVSVMLGMGCGGGALALLPADRVLAARLSWMSPLPLEGASVIRHRTPDRAAEMAVAQQVGALSMAANGIVDAVIDEQPDAVAEPIEFIARAAATIGAELAALRVQDDEDRLARRRRRYGGPV